MRLPLDGMRVTELLCEFCRLVPGAPDWVMP